MELPSQLSDSNAEKRFALKLNQCEAVDGRLGHQLPHALHSVIVFWNFRNGIAQSAICMHINFRFYRRVRPVQEQGSAHDDPMAPGR